MESGSMKEDAQEEKTAPRTNFESSQKDSSRDNAKIPNAAALIASIIAIVGIGFGIYEFKESTDKTKQIQSLQKQIEELSTSSTVDSNQSAKIKVINSSWSGWSADYELEEETTYCELVLNKKCIVEISKFSDAKGDEWEEETLSFEITKISDEGVNIHTFQPFSNQEKGINLHSSQQDFLIETGKTLKLTTPTMDGGDVFILSLENK